MNHLVQIQGQNTWISLRKQKSCWNIEAFHYFLEELRKAIAGLNIILKYAKFKAFNYR